MPPVDDESRYLELQAAFRKTVAALERAERGIGALQTTVEALIDILVARGNLGEGHARLLGKLRQRAHRALGQTVRLRTEVDKYAVAGAEIDCAPRLHLCHARCCTLSVEMSAQDLEEGGIAWSFDEPYMLRREPDGYCTHIDRSGGGCVIYERRPAACREFDCRHDRRIWRDFDAMEPAPMPDGLAPLPCTLDSGRGQDR